MTETPLRTRSVNFFPAIDGKGKWHAVPLVTEEALCGVTVLLDTAAAPIVGTVSDFGGGRPFVYAAHPLACKRCFRLAGSFGYTPRTR